MTFFFWGGITVSRIGKHYQNVYCNSCVGPYLGNHAEALADLSVAINERPNAVLMPGLDCSPNAPKWTNFANSCQIFQQLSVGLFWASF